MGVSLEVLPGFLKKIQKYWKWLNKGIFNAKNSPRISKCMMVYIIIDPIVSNI